MRGNRGNSARKGNGVTERRAPDTRPGTLMLGEARDMAERVRDDMLAEAVLADPEGNSVLAMAITVVRAKHPTGALPFAYWVELQDNFDTLAADTVALAAIPQFVAGLDMPFAMRAELCRRIMTGERPLEDQAGYIVSELARPKR